MRRLVAVVVAVLSLFSVGACRRDKASATEADAGAGAVSSSSSSLGNPSGASAPPLPDTDAAFVSAAAALETSSADAGPTRRLSDPPRAGQTVDVGAGSFASGSTPGDDGRDPTLEPALVDVTLTAFTIDALPYPNDPSQPARTGVSREEAQRLCGERGARLCTELEWERACKGPDGDAFVSGAAWNAACEKEPARCASGFGARAMGVFGEWTDSRFAGEGEGAPVVRGADHRCASRQKAGRPEGIGFRCCKGAPNTAAVAPIEPRPGFKKTNIEPEKLAKIFASVPELGRIGADVRFFAQGDVANMQARSGASHEGITFTTAPILWSPEAGAELLVATGRGKTMSFVVALWTLPGDRYRFASSFLLVNDLSPVALAYEPTRRKELRWTSCWGCAGEEGFVSYRPDEHRVVVVQR